MLLAWRWRIAVLVMPVAGAVAALRWAVWSGKGVDAVGLDASVMQITVMTCIFVCSLLLSGVLGDYKEAERLPAEVESVLRTALSVVLLRTRSDAGARARAVATLRRTLASFVSLLDGSRRYDEFTDDVAEAEASISDDLCAPSGGAAPVTLAPLLARAARLCVIRDTSFPLPAYALFDTMTALVSGAAVAVRLSDPAAGYFVAAAFPFIFVYMGLLLRQIDDPFQYPPGFHSARMEAALARGGSSSAKPAPLPASLCPTSIDCRLLVEELAVCLQRHERLALGGGAAASTAVAVGGRGADSLQQRSAGGRGGAAGPAVALRAPLLQGDSG